MSDEFKEVAQKEINQELESNSQILKSCSNDEDIEKNSHEIEKHLHKLKGLAPMTGYKSIGELASLNDSLIKKILEGKKIAGIFETISKSNQLMKEIMQNSNISIDELKQTIKTKHSAFLD
ncbi:MAG: phosphorelay protein [Nitrosopumilaceae archaeon]